MYDRLVLKAYKPEWETDRDRDMDGGRERGHAHKGKDVLGVPRRL
jgi:hypothetical protein